MNALAAVSLRQRVQKSAGGMPMQLFIQIPFLSWVRRSMLAK
jgi:hypothetical protein